MLSWLGTVIVHACLTFSYPSKVSGADKDYYSVVVSLKEAETLRLAANFGVVSNIQLLLCSGQSITQHAHSSKHEKDIQAHLQLARYDGQCRAHAKILQQRTVLHNAGDIGPSRPDRPEGRGS